MKCPATIFQYKLSIPGTKKSQLYSRSQNDFKQLPGCKKDARRSKFPAQGWSGWGAWGECSTSCGDGYRTRLRPCGTRPNCDGHQVEKEDCSNQAPCPITPLPQLDGDIQQLPISGPEGEKGENCINLFFLFA